MNRYRSSLACIALLLAITSGNVSAQSLRDRLKAAAEKAAAAAEKAGKAAGTLLPISTEKEIEIGRGIAATIAGRYKVSQDTSLTTYVNLVGLVSAGEAPREDVAYRFAVLETTDVNAFAAPGGYIFITRGALDLIETEAELAGVLAHEVAHVNKRHVIEQIRKADVMREVRDQAGIEGDRLDKIVGHGSNVLFTGLSRDDEAAADSLGVQYAAGAGYDPAGLSAFVTRLQQRSSDSRLLELMSTHPRPADRLGRINRIAERSGPGGATLAERYRTFVPKR